MRECASIYLIYFIDFPSRLRPSRHFVVFAHTHTFIANGSKLIFKSCYSLYIYICFNVISSSNFVPFSFAAFKNNNLPFLRWNNLSLHCNGNWRHYIGEALHWRALQSIILLKFTKDQWKNTCVWWSLSILSYRRTDGKPNALFL